MSRNYDSNWEKLVGAVLRREKDRQLAFCESFSTSTSLDFSLRFSSCSFNPLDEDVAVSRSSGRRLDPGSLLITKTFISRDELIIEYEEIKKATNYFQSYLENDYRGISTSMYKGWIHELYLTATNPGSGIAVRVEKRSYSGSQGDEEWLDEINYFGRLRHPNLVKLIGYSFDTDNRILVYELMQRGCLETHLFASKHQSLPWATRIKVALGAARGLTFLHDLETPIIHRDVKIGTILLDDDYNAKLSHFTHAIACPESDVSTDVIGTYGYAAPEYLSTGRVTTRCDVYGFGVVLVELMSGLRAIDRNRHVEMHDLIEWARPYLGAKKRLWRIMDIRLGGQYPEREAHKVAMIAFRCVSIDPRLRPRMSEVVAALENL